ncbi:MAG TPA: aldo/keto reductase [Novosphingobium sp.]|nr:aldo/keto reductase [Novosphingobium sp.]
MADDPMANHPAFGGLPLIFGGNVFGWTTDRDRGFEILDAFHEAGGRMIDTAEVYGHDIKSEAVIGEWMESRGVRKDMLIATKTGIPGIPGALAPDKVRTALQGSLERLRTDYVDLYYVHKDDETTPLDEVVDVYDEAVHSGKAREVGGSKYTVDRLKAIVALAEERGKTPFTWFQPKYNLVARAEEYEGELQDFCLAKGIAVAPFYSLAAGFLTGKFRSAGDWKGSTRDYALEAAAADGGWRVLDTVRAVAADIGVPPAQVAIAWVKAQPGIAAPLASATSPAQLADLVAAVSLALSAEHLARLDAG